MKRRTIMLAALLTAGGCKKAAETPAVGSGSGSSAPVPTGGSGSGSGPAATATPDAARGVGFSTEITPDGIGPITATTNPKTIAAAFPGLESENDIQEREDSKVEYIKLTKSKTPILTAVVDHFTSETAVWKVVVTDAMFATPSGIGVASTIMDLAKKHPDTKCYFETYDAEADVEGVDRLLFCQVGSLPRLSFQLDAAAMKGKPGEVGINILARQRIVEIVWLPSARVTVPTGSIGAITATAVGPITATTPTTVEAVKQAIPSHDVASVVVPGTGGGVDTTVIMVSRGKDTPVLSIELAGKDRKGTAHMTIHDSGFATSGGIAVGSTIKELGAKETGVVCSFTNVDGPELSCRAKSQPNLDFVVATNDLELKDGTSVPLKKIGTRTIKEILWRTK